MFVSQLIDNGLGETGKDDVRESFLLAFEFCEFCWVLWCSCGCFEEVFELQVVGYGLQIAMPV